VEINPKLIHVVYSRADWEETTPWLEANVGKFNETWYKLGRDILVGYAVGWPGDEYRFLREQDAAWFALRWA
jgi:hypothetical protein